MTKTKTNRIFLGVVTMAMALAGTGLTIANNWENDIQIAAIALTLAACFTAAEASFLWGHKCFEKASRFWRKCVLAVSLAVLVGSMAFAVYEELRLALRKVANRGLAQNSGLVVSSADKTNQRAIARSALKILGDGKVESNPIPFVVCYLVTGLVSIAILAVTEKPRERTNRKGNLLEGNEELAKKVRAAGYNPSDVRVYAVRGGGYAIHSKEGYQGHLKDKKDSMGFMS